MSEQEIFERTQRIIAQEKRVPLERVTMESSFADLGIDSLEGVVILYALEKEFNISIPDDATHTMKSVAQVVHGLASLVAPDA